MGDQNGKTRFGSCYEIEKLNGISKEAELSIAASSMFPGFRFSPTDEELLLYYLKKKVDGFDKCVEVITEVDICKFEPWDLPAKAVITSDQEWFFFSPRGKKYPNGSQSRRATEIGYWKATGKERAVKSGLNLIGTKRTLVFHIGRAPKGERTEWIMHEYCMTGKGQDTLVVCRLRKKCEYHAIDGLNGEINCAKPISMIDSSGASSGFEVDGIDTPRGDKMPESSLKKCSSSHDSHSVEQIDSACESDRKFKDEIMQPESSSHCPKKEEDDDLFADILNDNIIQLDDECLPTSTTPPAHDLTATSTSSNVSIVPRVHDYHHPQGQQQQPRFYPFQGSASRRIRLRKLSRKFSPQKDALAEGSGENVISSPNVKAKKSKNFMVNKLFVAMSLVAFAVLILPFGLSWFCYCPPPVLL